MRPGTPKIIRVVGTAITHPAQMISVLSGRNITTFLNLLRESGLKVAFSNTLRVVNNSISDIERINELCGTDIKAFSGEVVKVTCSEKPLVSVLIPVYNQFEYTYWCIRSIVETTESIDYEIIVADDQSSDSTLQIQDFLPGIILIRNEKNLRYTLNCNNAAKKAKGKYLILLNNDTIVTKGWMQSLIQTMENRPDAGIVGSKLLYPDGVLQEDGCVIWQDGTAWNVGKGLNPNLPEFNYLKEADYVSAASLIIRKDLWDENGGFDERYAPSYCEDSDLAFQIRARGYKVLCQPKSVVIHFEGMTKGKAVSSQLKSYQIVNTQKFQEKWKIVLEDQHPVGRDMFTARDRSDQKKCIVFIDEGVTNFEGDDYDKHVANKILDCVKSGNSVKLIPDNYIFNEKNTTIFQNEGVEVLYGGEARRDGNKWIRNYKKYVDQAIICRPSLVNKYSKLFRGVDIKILYTEYEKLKKKQKTNNSPTIGE